MRHALISLSALALCCACGSSSGNGSSSGSAGSGSGSGSSGSSGASTGGSSGCMAPTTVAAAREACNQGQTAAITNATVLYEEPASATLGDGGTMSLVSNYILVDSTGLGILAYHDDVKPSPGYAPSSADVVTAAGPISTYEGQIQIAPPTFTFVSHGTLPSPAAATAAQLVGQPTDTSQLAHYVTVPAGTYTQSASDPAFAKYMDGVSLTDGSGDKILVYFYPLEASSTACYPTADGGNPDLSHGGFNGFFDTVTTEDGKVNGVIFYGNCGQ